MNGFEYVPIAAGRSLHKVVAHQPISVGIEAGGCGFHLYGSEVSTGCCGTSLDHGVVVVGYGRAAADDARGYYATRRRRLGRWGKGSYILMEHNVSARAGKRGIAVEPSYPIKNRPNLSPKPRPSRRYNACLAGSTGFSSSSLD